MVGELLNEIMEKIKEKAFNYDLAQTERRAKDLISKEKYWVFVAREVETNTNVGFVSMYESYALYSEGAYGTIPELFVRPKWRSEMVGKALLQKAVDFAASRDWKRLEVTTPPLPEFDRTLEFYKSNGFEVSGGRKLKVDINA
jgi:GNAT superfamily N-acetyltransferase